MLVYARGAIARQVGVAWRYGVANLSRRRAESLVQIVGVRLGLMVLLLLGLVRNDLTRTTGASACPRTCRITSSSTSRRSDRDAFIGVLAERGAQTSRVLPMIRGRMTQINGRAGRAACVRG